MLEINTIKPQRIEIKGTFYKQPGFFFRYLPIRVPYADLAYKAQSQGYKLKNIPDKCEIIEKTVSFGKGWIAVEIHDPGVVQDPNVILLNDTYSSYLLKGSYQQLIPVYHKIMQEYPNSKEMLNVFLNSPDHVNDDSELRTLIIWK